MPLNLYFNDLSFDWLIFSREHTTSETEIKNGMFEPETGSETKEGENKLRVQREGLGEVLTLYLYQRVVKQ